MQPPDRAGARDRLRKRALENQRLDRRVYREDAVGRKTVERKWPARRANIGPRAQGIMRPLKAPLKRSEPPASLSLQKDLFYYSGWAAAPAFRRLIESTAAARPEGAGGTARREGIVSARLAL